MKHNVQSFHIPDLHHLLWGMAGKIATYLANNFTDKQGFSTRDYYGTAFACWLWSYPRFGYVQKLPAAFEYLNLLPKPHRGIGKYHWEFVRFALENMQRNLPPEQHVTVREILGDELFADTRVANWILLRSTVRLFSSDKKQNFIATLERWATLWYFQQSDGFITDEHGKPSAQYHAFCTALLGLQIFEIGIKENFTRKRFVKALHTLNLLTLADGECNYWGRGQRQIFGYAATVLAFVLGAAIEDNLSYLEKARQVAIRLNRAIRPDGSLPLVLDVEEPPEPFSTDFVHTQKLGWYRYNNYFDYLAFTGALLAKTATILESFGAQTIVSAPIETEEVKSQMNDIRFFRNQHYTAVVSRPMKSLAASLCFPYVAIGNQFPLPVYGGEEHGGLYTAQGLPLPILLSPEKQTLSIYQLLKFKWLNADTLLGYGKGIAYERHFTFEQKTIQIRDDFRFINTGWANWHISSPRFLVNNAQSQQIAPNQVQIKCVVITASKPIRPENQLYPSATGMLCAYSSSFAPILPNIWQSDTIRIKIL